VLEGLLEARISISSTKGRIVSREFHIPVIVNG
jgi:hypothetical protein